MKKPCSKSLDGQKLHFHWICVADLSVEPVVRPAITSTPKAQQHQRTSITGGLQHIDFHQRDPKGSRFPTCTFLRKFETNSPLILLALSGPSPSQSSRDTASELEKCIDRPGAGKLKTTKE